MEQRIEYRGCTIIFDPKPIPDRRHDWDWTHKDYDGPPDNRLGACASVEECKAEIDERI